MSITDISFPNLGIYLHNVPKSFTVFGISIALYGVIIAIGMLAGTVIAAHISKRTKELNPDIIWDFVIYAIIISVICARIYYVVFQWDYYKNNLLSIFNIREGGLAIYGGVIGAFITIYIYSRWKKVNALVLGDCGVVGLILGQAIGRWGNFTNREVFGQYTDNLFAMRLPIDAVRASDISESLASHIEAGTNYIQVHPTFLYESAWNLLIFALLLIYWNHKKFDGEICLCYFAGYGIGRAVIEGIRTDTLFLPHTTIKVSQLLAIIMVVCSVTWDIIMRIRISKRGQATADSLEISSKEETTTEESAIKEVHNENT